MNQIPKKTLYLLIIFMIVVGLIVFVVWKGFFAEPNTKDLDLKQPGIMEVSLDLSLLESDKVKKLKLFKKLPELKKTPGRKNPFNDYQGTSSDATPE